jgi:glycosyltransferase involved in cell wall biosynthesis
MIKVFIQQQVLPPYRRSFFEGLGKVVDLTVALADNIEIPGASTIERNFRSGSFDVRWYHERQFLGRRYQSGFVADVLAEEPDVVVAGAGYLPYYFWNLKAAKDVASVGARLVAWGCDGYQFSSMDEWDSFRRERIRRWLHHAYLGLQYRQNVSGFIGYSQMTADFWRGAYAIPSNRIFVAENALSTMECEESYHRGKRGELSRDLSNVIFVGRLIEGKSIDLLIRAIGALSERGCRLRLTLVGDGPATESLVALSKSLRDPGVVNFVGRISDKSRLGDLLASSGLFVLPGYGGLAINEAMAAGLPVICSRGDGTEGHLVEQGKTGYVVQRSDVDALVEKIGYMISHPDDARRMGDYAHTLVTTRYGLDNMIARFADALHTCAQRST